MSGSAATLWPHDAEAVRVVHYVEAIVAFAGLDQLWHAADMALHRVNTLENDDLRRLGFFKGDNVLQIGGVVVRKTLHTGLSEADASPKRAVDVLIDQHDVALLGKGLNGRHAGNITGDGDVAGFLADEIGELFLQRNVVAAGAIGQTGAGGAAAPFVEAFLGCFEHLGVVAEPQVVITTEHDILFAVLDDAGASLAFKRVVVWIVTFAKPRNIVVLAALDDGIFGF